MLADFPDLPATSVAFRLPGFPGDGGVHHAFSTRHGGVNPQGSGSTGPERFLAAAFPPGTTLALPNQVHGDQIWRPDASLAGGASPQRADAAVTAASRRAVGVRTADCVPILLADTGARVVAAVHMGWRGALAGIVGGSVGALLAEGASPDGLAAAIGPAIGVCCFEVGAEVAEPFAALDPALVDRAPGHPHVDLPAAAALLLQRAGVPTASIHETGLCTHCRTDLFFSYRRESGCSGRLLSAIALA